VGHLLIALVSETVVMFVCSHLVIQMMTMLEPILLALFPGMDWVVFGLPIRHVQMSSQPINAESMYVILLLGTVWKMMHLHHLWHPVLNMIVSPSLASPSQCSSIHCVILWEAMNQFVLLLDATIQ